jgi:arylsulfatase A
VFLEDPVKQFLLIVSCLIVLGSPQVGFADDPNIIVIYTDDQGFGDASCYNPNSKFKTPNLDRLASEGIRFTNAHSSDTVCTPSRYGLLTGRYCWRTVKKTGVLGAESECLISDDRMTIASMLQSNGYETAMVGKWHLGMDFPGERGSRDWSQPVADMPLDKGFDYFYGIPASLNYGVLAWFEGRQAKVPPTLFTNKKPNKRHLDYRIMPPYQSTPGETKQELNKLGFEVAPDFIDNQCLTRFTDKAIAWMKNRVENKTKKSAVSKSPFFVYLPYTSPHYPVSPLPEFWGRGECGGYGEFVIETDHHIGRVLDFLKTSGLDQNTMVVFTSDNGPENSWRQRVQKFGHHSNANYRGGKRDIYEGGHRVPFMIRWPGGIQQPGRSFDGLVGQVDLIATIAELVGVELPAAAGEDSQSFADVLSNADSRRIRLPLVNHASNGQFAITKSKWKLVLPHKKKKQELYDLTADPGETNDVVSDHPEIAKSLESMITKIVCNGRTTRGAAQTNDTGYWSDLAWMKSEDYTGAPADDHRVQPATNHSEATTQKELR